MWGNAFNKDGLDAKTRLMVVIAGLTVLGAHAEPQFKLTVRHAMEAGATQKEIAEVIYQMAIGRDPRHEPRAASGAGSVQRDQRGG